MNTKQTNNTLKNTVFAVVSLVAALYGADTRAVPHRVALDDVCVQAAEERMGIDIEPAGSSSRGIRNASGSGQLVYLDVAAVDSAKPVNMRLYCSVSAAGEIDNVTSMPRLIARSDSE